MTNEKESHLHESQQLAAFASQLQFDDIPDATIRRIKLCLLDAAGCALFASTLPWGKILSDYVIDQQGREQAYIWGRHQRVPAAMAALVNGTLIHGFELDDLHKASILHPSSAVMPAALAIAEAQGGISGRAFLTACVAGFEVGARAGMSVGTAHLVQGFHPTGTHGTVAAAAAAGRLLGLDPKQMEHAISIAATQASGLMAAQFESMVKRMHAGRASQSGVYGAELAERGFTGIDDVFEAPYGGYCSTLSTAPNPAVIAQDLGTVFETEKVGFKVYSCCGSCHTSVEAARRIRARQKIAPADIERIEVSSSMATLLHVGWPYEPRSITSAQMNLPYCLAVTLIDGDAFVEQFTAERIVEKSVCELASRVEVKHDSAFDALGPSGRHKVHVAIYMKNGVCLEEAVDHAKGSDQNPLTPDEVVEKFHRIAASVCGETWSTDAFELMMSLETLSSTDPLSDLLSRSN